LQFWEGNKDVAMILSNPLYVHLWNQKVEWSVGKTKQKTGLIEE
jgi:hypothetical protein